MVTIEFRGCSRGMENDGMRSASGRSMIIAADNLNCVHPMEQGRHFRVKLGGRAAHHSRGGVRK